MATDSPEAIGRTMPAQSPPAPPDSASNAVTAVKALVADVVATRATTPNDAAPPPPAAQAPAIVPAMPGVAVPAVSIIPATDEEQLLLAVLRLIDRVVSPGTLSPVERAFVAGAKVMFDHLSNECERMLGHKVSDLTGYGADPTTPLESTGNVRLPTPKKSSPRRSKKKASPPKL